MTKEIKKYYHYLDLPYSATEEEVLINEKSMIKVARALAIKKKKSSKLEVEKIATYSNIVINFLL